MTVRVLTVLCVLATLPWPATPARAQVSDTLRVLLPASRQGIRFVPPRPNGRRIIIVPAAPAPPTLGQSPPPGPATAGVPDAETRRMLRLLEESVRDLRTDIARQEREARRERSRLLDSLDALSYRLESGLTATPAAIRAETRSTQPAVPLPSAPLPDSARPAPSRAVQPGNVRTPDPDVIERLILDTGLFTAVQVVFELNSSTLLPFAYPTLDALSEVLLRNPDLELDVVGHTDSTGPADYNRDLSRRRAESVVTYLQSRGVARGRLVPVGRGEEEPIADNTMATGRVLNRRVEFVVR